MFIYYVPWFDEKDLNILTFTYQFAKSQEFSNVGALQIFERKVLLSALSSRTIFEGDLLSSDSVANLGFSETDMTISLKQHATICFTISRFYWNSLDLSTLTFHSLTKVALNQKLY